MAYIPDASPDNKRPTHHAVLSDGSTLIGLVALNASGAQDAKAIRRSAVDKSSLKTSTGDQKYSDFRLPYASIAQDDWSGGRGNLDFVKDATRFLDSNRAETERSGRIILGGRERYGDGLRAEVLKLPADGSVRLTGLFGQRQYMAVRVQPTLEFTIKQIWLLLRYVGNPADLTVRLRNDNDGRPGNIRFEKKLSTTDLASAMISEMAVIPVSGGRLIGRIYWLEVLGDEGESQDNCWEVGCRLLEGDTKESKDGLNWKDSARDMYFRVTTPAENDDPGMFFEYKRMLFFVTMPWDGTRSRLYINGIAGKANVNNQHIPDIFEAELWPNYQPPGIATDWRLEANELKGGVLVLVKGEGMREEYNWRVIKGNTSSSQALKFTLETPFSTNLMKSGTRFVVLGTNKWTELDVGKHLRKSVTDVAVVHEETDDAYVVFGFDNNLGVQCMKMDGLDLDWQDIMPVNARYLSTRKTTELKLVRVIGNRISECNAPPWSVLATLPILFGTGGSVVSDIYDRVNNLAEYEGKMWIFTEAAIYTWDGTDVVKLPIDELRQIRSEQIGRRWARQNVYMLFSVMKTVWRYYEQNFDDVGFMLGEGLPKNRQGNISGIVAYPGRHTVSVDAGSSGYSSVLTSGGGGAWHEKYRSPKGQRITAIYHQVVPGPNPDRLWMRQGGDFVWIPYPSDTFDPYLDPNYPYAWESVVEFSDWTGGLVDAWKYWRSIKLHTENLISNVTWIEVDYKLDDGSWKTLETPFTESPLQEVKFIKEKGKGIKLRLRLYSTDPFRTPRVKAVILETVTVTEPKFAYAFSTRVTERDLNDEIDSSMAPWEKIRKLDLWSGTAQPLVLQCVNPLFDKTEVFLQPIPASPLTSSELLDENQERKWSYLIGIVLQEA